MKIISIDVGIKNLSFCLFELQNIELQNVELQNIELQNIELQNVELQNVLLQDIILPSNNPIINNLKIIKWDNINLGEKIESKCIVIDKNGLCDKPAKFTKDGNCYCLKHAKKQPYLIPGVDLKPSYINKQKIQNLMLIADKYKIKYDVSIKKINLISLINKFITNNCFTSVEKTNACKVDLVTIGKNLQFKFDDILCDHLSSIEIIIIENQIGPIANKMKTIQGMISQYFIMKNNNIQIEFISASNKLKDYLPKKEEKVMKKEKEEKEEVIEKGKVIEKLDYKQRKKLGIQTCLEIIASDNRFNEWTTFFNKHTKKDDLSDCFLQGMWFIKYKIK